MSDLRKELLQELRTIREECNEQSKRLARIIGELTEAERPRTDRQIVEQTNELARQFGRILGWETTPGVQIYREVNPRARDFWNLACAAQEALTATDPNDALRNL